jgi:hypothetical protein
MGEEERSAAFGEKSAPRCRARERFFVVAPAYDPDLRGVHSCEECEHNDMFEGQGGVTQMRL